MATTLSGWKHLHTDFSSGQLAVYKETLTKGTSIADELGSEISFIPPGTDFTILLVPAATVSTGVDVAVQGAPVSDGDYATLQDDVVVNAGDAGPDAGIYNVTTATTKYGEMPYYKLFFDGDAVSQANLNVYITFLIP